MIEPLSSVIDKEFSDLVRTREGAGASDFFTPRSYVAAHDAAREHYPDYHRPARPGAVSRGLTRERLRPGPKRFGRPASLPELFNETDAALPVRIALCHWRAADEIRAS